MTYTSGAIALLSVIVAIHLFFTFSLTQRVRLILETAMFHGDSADLNPVEGTVIGQFAEVDTHRRPVSLEDLRGGTQLIGFFSTGCPRCASIVADLAANPPEEPLLAFVESDGTGQAADGLTGLLSTFARVVVFERGSPVIDAFAVKAFPTLLRVRDGVVVISGGRPRELGLGVPLDRQGRTR